MKLRQIPRGPRRAKDKFLKNIGIGLLLGLAILAVVSLYGQPLTSQEEAGISRVVQEIQRGNVDHIAVEQEDLTVQLKDSSTALLARKESGTSITETLLNLGVTPEQLQNITLTVEAPSGTMFWVSTLLPVLLPFLLLGAFLWFMMRSAQNASSQALGFGQMRSQPVHAEDGKGKKRTTFKDVAGNEEAKNELLEVVEFLKTPKKFQKMGARIPKGVLLIGPPGTGKTLMARAVAGEANVPFFSISGSEFVEMFVGVGASRVRDIFRKVKQHAPAILFVDEMDAVGRHRGAGLGGGHDEREQTLNQILVEMDGFEQNDNVIVLGATNRPDVLDPALLRPGRFDRQVRLDLPDIAERNAILDIHSKAVPRAADVKLRNIAERTPGFSGADLANLVNEAAILAARQDKDQVTQRHLEDSIEKVLLGPEKRSKVFSKEEKRITAYHEAGHAIVAYHMPAMDPVRKISIISRGHAGGYTLKLPEEDRHLHTRTQFRGELATLMGGYTAELITFNELTTGASNDLSKATSLARSIVTDFGMSKLGPMTFGHKEEYVFLGKELHEARNYSEDTAAKIDGAIAGLLTEAQAEAERILRRHHDQLELIAQTLIDKETIGQAEFKALMEGNDAPEQPPAGPAPAPLTPEPQPVPTAPRPVPSPA
ncbi:MAG: cell division protein FtsH [Candidatus Andersenbacteria bacterium CG10_big_fil_rev_8_21_14_0_10_54_11]|uniref:ATP-dependent zinc metalloprotease FtsH n=1 Tax=Candidatus Andersenbacteria bacterium CG10_big_fil_rev_8_21_14_0_10_54_11 TaxID=1974485 RepID=A0A2M6WZU5_9BACT|nr:MAG: cell division protein FtsH [Candidatus Andersenbacteria bacterium CG10_big_fil_rev_8_21_14_0_10_54_11]